LWLCTSIPFTWYVVMGSVTTFTIGYGASWLMPRNDRTEYAEELR